MTLEKEIKAEAKALGFVLAGISAANPAPHFPHYLGWLEQGFHAGMGYLARADAIENRQDPSRLLPGCQSVLSVAVAYPAPRADEAGKGYGARGKIAAYALFPDYHDLLGSRLVLLADRLRTLLGKPFSWRACVDTSAILERDYASQAGLGWIGRNSCLITAEAGSWVLLGELLLDVALEPDAPIAAAGCENCQRCVMACPTKALQPNRTVDARSCLSYLTIEHRGPIPEEFRALMGSRVFGCDTCQAVCPHNQLREGSGNGATITPVIEGNPLLRDLLEMTEVEFNARFKGTPVTRCRHRGMLRNAAIAAGNSGQKDLISTLASLHERTNDPAAQEAAAWAIAQLSK